MPLVYLVYLVGLGPYRDLPKLLMDSPDKKSLNERDVYTKLITPPIEQTGAGVLAPASQRKNGAA